MKTKTVILVFAAIFTAVSASAYNFLFTAHRSGVVALANDKGEILWSIEAEHPQRADLSPDGKTVFISELHGARMVSVADKKTLWQYKCPEVVWDGVETKTLKKGNKVRLQNPVAQILGNDRFLVGNEGISTLLEIDSKGNVHKTIKSETKNRVHHGEFRLAAKVGNKYIFPMISSNLLTIYDANGRQIRRIETPDGVVSAQLLPDNSLLTGGIYGLAIYDTADKIKWSFTSKELQQALGTKSPVVICDAKFLPDGNILCTTYGNKSVPDVLEISPDKKIVKKIDFPQYSYFSALQIF